MKDFFELNTAGLIGAVITFYQKPGEVHVEGRHYPDFVKHPDDPEKVLHIQKVEYVEILFPSEQPNTMGVVSMPGHLILAMAARINELQAKEEYLNMGE